MINILARRPLKRVIQQEIKKPLADELLFGRLVEGGEVKIDCKDKKLIIDIEPGKSGHKT